MKIIMRIYSFFRIVFILLQNLTHIPAYLISTLVVLYPLYLINPRLYWKIENYLYNFNLYTVAAWSWCGGIRVHEYGDSFVDLGKHNRKLQEKSNSPEVIDVQGSTEQGEGESSPKQEIDELLQIETDSRVGVDGDQNNSATTTLTPPPVLNGPTKLLFIANHQDTGDVPLMFQMFTHYWDKVLLWVMDRQFKYTNFGLVSWTHGDYFILPGKFVPNDLTKHCRRNPEKNCFILFPEGGFRYKKVESSRRYSDKVNLPYLKNVVWPRFGAFNDLIDKSVGLTHIVDVTIIYPSIEKTISILDILKGQRKTEVYMIFRTFDLNDIEPNNEWMNELWKQKDSMMEEFYEDKEKFLSKYERIRVARLSSVKLFFINIFYLLLTIGYIVIFMFLFKAI